MIRKVFPVGPLQCNCIILACEKNKEAVIVDPGADAQLIMSQLATEAYQVKYLLHTHAHFDHVGATGVLKEKTSGLVCLHKGDQPLYDNLPMQGQLFGLNVEAGPAIEKYIEDEETLTFGTNTIKVLHTPGHSPGSVCFSVTGEEEFLLSGDTLFKQSIGRTDLWGGDTDAILRSIKQRLLVFEGELPVYPGHGPETSIGEEKTQNPFLI